MGVIVERIGSATLYCGDCREILPTLESRFDFVVTDPPYSSGGLMRSDRNAGTSQKYVMDNSKNCSLPNFCGDNRDQRSFILWCSDWLGKALSLCAPGAILTVCIDWRNLPCIIDAVQVGGWVYRGIVVWDKTEGSRPTPGWFRSQCEYIVTASHGPLNRDDGKIKPGLFRYQSPRDRLHSTQKPVELMAQILDVAPHARACLDPFMGSGTTGVAALRRGMEFVGIEATPEYFDVACRRLETEVQRLKDPYQIQLLENVG